jgi:hypothetical protein
MAEAVAAHQFLELPELVAHMALTMATPLPQIH